MKICNLSSATILLSFLSAQYVWKICLMKCQQAYNVVTLFTVHGIIEIIKSIFQSLEHKTKCPLCRNRVTAK
jgi:hypothetical protein